MRRLQLRFVCDSTAVRLPFDCNSITVPPFYVIGSGGTSYEKLEGPIFFAAAPHYSSLPPTYWRHRRYMPFCHPVEAMHAVTIIGVGTYFGVGVGEARERGDGVLGDGTASLPHQPGVCGSAVNSLSGVRKVFLYSEPSDCLFQHLSTCSYSLHG